MTNWSPWEGAHGLGVVRIEDEDEDDAWADREKCPSLHLRMYDV